jgi:hypothetical protein
MRHSIPPRKLWLLLSVLTVALGVFAGTAAAATRTITLTAAPNPVVTGGAVTFSGTVADDGVGAADVAVTATQYDDVACTIPTAGGSFDFGTTDANGDYSHVLIASVPPGHYFFQASVSGAVSPCFDASVIGKPATPAQATNVFLCYSKFQGDPSVWPMPTATKLMGEGYWQPYAVAGHAAGGTNVGTTAHPYHLVCNLSGSQATTGQYVDNDGELIPSVFAGVPGIYAVAK